jgi:molecular chaperone GrpE (heat shock protein)
MVDRFHTTSKDGLVDKLLDFLGAPQKNKIKGVSGKVTSSSTSTTKKSTTKKSKPTKRAKTGKKNDEEEDDEDGEEEEEDDENANDDDDGYDDVDDDKLQNGDADGELPTKEKLRKWVRAYVRCFHETKLTVNHALEIGSEKFGIDLLPMKADLKKLLIEEL